jgi:hypothetical protein
MTDRRQASSVIISLIITALFINPAAKIKAGERERGRRMLTVV